MIVGDELPGLLALSGDVSPPSGTCIASIVDRVYRVQEYGNSRNTAVLMCTLVPVLKSGTPGVPELKYLFWNDAIKKD